MKLTVENIVSSSISYNIHDNYPSDDSLRIIFTGDFCPINRVEKLVKNNQYHELYGDYISELRNKDLSITNLECPLTNIYNPIPKRGPHLMADPSCANVLRYGGFDVACLANNHSLDQGESGLIDTIRHCETEGIKTVGAGRSIIEASEPLYITIKGTKIGILNFAEHEFSIATDKTAGSNPLDPVDNYFKITETKANADITLVVIHGGNEYYSLPSPRMMKQYRYYAELGVTAVIGHHTHTPGSFEIYRGVPIFYSLGNFIFDWKLAKSKGWYQNYFIKLVFKKSRLSDIYLIPYIQNKHKIGLDTIEDKDRVSFLNEIRLLSELIKDPEKVESEWRAFCERSHDKYIVKAANMNRYLGYLVHKKVLPSNLLFSGKNKLRLLNLIRCQSHRDVLIELLSNSNH